MPARRDPVSAPGLDRNLDSRPIDRVGRGGGIESRSKIKIKDRRAAVTEESGFSC